MFQIIEAIGNAIDELASRYRHWRDNTNIHGRSTSVSFQHGSAPPSYYQILPPSPYYQTLSLPPQPSLSESVWPPPSPPPPMLVATPPPLPPQRPPASMSHPTVRPRPYRPPRGPVLVFFAGIEEAW
nr:leucine-rich repeat extensin-like protein 3 [Arachis hypogaea]